MNSSINPFERLDPVIKLKTKPIPPPLSVITTLPISSNLIESPSFFTPTSILGNQHQSPATTFSPILKQPTPLKSILKQPSHLSSSIPNETRKAVHIISTKPSVDSTVKRILPSEDKKKSIIQPKPIINPQPVKTNQLKPIQTTKKAIDPIKTIHEGNKITKIPSEMTKKTLVTNETVKLKSQSLLKEPVNPKNKISKKPSTEFLKKKLKQTSCMYDRIKERSRHERNRNKYFSIDK